MCTLKTTDLKLENDYLQPLINMIKTETNVFVGVVVVVAELLQFERAHHRVQASERECGPWHGRVDGGLGDDVKEVVHVEGEVPAHVHLAQPQHLVVGLESRFFCLFWKGWNILN